MLIAEPATRADELLDRAERLLDDRCIDAAMESFAEAELAGANPDRCSAGRWQVAMLRGDFESAWQESDAIQARGSGNGDSFWHGEEIDGKRVIVRCLHGFGDAVQMLRFAPQLAARAESVVYETSPRLLPLARCIHRVADAMTWEHAAPEWEVQVEVTELPYLFRTTIDDLPIATNYITLPPELLSHVAEQLGPKERPRVGLVWTCGDWNPTRNVPPDALGSLQDLDVEFWNLQSHSASSECPLLQMRDGRSITDGLVELASTIANMDLIITPDTLAAHLAGAMGKPAFMMLQYAADWRWMMHRSDTPWYPSLHLFRQPSPGDWASVIQEIRANLQTLVW